MLQKIDLEHILFLDIETVPEESQYSRLDEIKKELWDHKSQYRRAEDVSAEEYYDNARSFAFLWGIFILKAVNGNSV